MGNVLDPFSQGQSLNFEIGGKNGSGRHVTMAYLYRYTYAYICMYMYPHAFAYYEHVETHDYSMYTFGTYSVHVLNQIHHKFF